MPLQGKNSRIRLVRASCQDFQDLAVQNSGKQAHVLKKLYRYLLLKQWPIALMARAHYLIALLCCMSCNSRTRRLKLKLALEESGFMAERLGSCNSLTAGVPLLERNAMVLNAAGMDTAAKIQDLCLQ